MLSNYQFSCGHVLRSVISSDHLFETSLDMYMEHNHYHVRAFKYVKNSSSSNKILWEVFDSYNEAKKYFKKIAKRPKVILKSTDK